MLDFVKKFWWVTLVPLLLFWLGGVAGCTIHLHGGGELAAGMRNDNFFVMRHTVDGDKMGKESAATLEADSLLDLLAGQAKDEPDAAPTP